MLGNGVCEVACNTQACSYDRSDCICSSSCYPEDYGQCKPQCLTIACDSDGYGRAGGCTDKFAFTSNLYASIIANSLTAVFDSKQSCEEPHSCSLAALKQSYQSGKCTTTCGSPDCLYSMGTCMTVTTATCTKSYGSEYGNCLQCLKGLKQYLGYCVKACPRGYQELPATTGLCRDKVNDDSVVDEIYVYEGEQEVRGDGSFDSPYYSLTIALAAAWRKRTVIYVLGSNAELTVQSGKALEDDELLHHSNDLDLLADSKCQDLTIRSLTCSETTHTKCSTTPAEFEVHDEVTFNATGKRLTFSNVVFTAGCARTDIGKMCYSHPSLSLILAGPSSVVTMTVSAIQAVSFKDMKVKSVIYINFGTVTLNNVDFTNAEACNNAKSCGIILQTGDCSSFNYCNSLSYTGGSVTQTNSARTLSDETSPFLYLNYMQSISVSGVSFSYNLLATSAANSGIIALNKFLSMRIVDCIFANNGSTKSLVMVDSSMSIPLVADSTNTATLLLQPHITFQGVKMMNNFAYKSLVYVGMNKDVLNVVMKFCEFDSSSNGADAVTVEYIGGFPQGRIDGAFQSVYNQYTKITKDVFIPKSTIDITDSIFSKQGCFSSIINVKNCANLKIKNVTLTDSGSDDDDYLMQAAIERFLKSPEISCSVIPQYGTDARCSSLIQIESLENLSVDGLISTGNTCFFGGTAVSLLEVFGSIHSFFASKNTAGKSSSAVLYVRDRCIVTVTNLTAISNSGSGKGAVYVVGEGVTELILTDSTFSDNLASTGSAVYAEGVVQVTVKSTVFRGNSVQSSSGGAIFYSSANSETSIVLTDCRFEGNRALLGGALYVSSEVADWVTLVTVSNCRFIGNSASEGGASVYLDGKLSLNSASAISNCEFAGESSPGAAVALFFRRGSLRLEGSTFSSNSGATASCVVIQTASSATTVLSGVVFDSNAGASPIVKPNFRVYSHFTTDRCAFRNHKHTAIVLEGGEWTDTDSEFTAAEESAVEVYNWAVVQCARTVFLRNSSTSQGGAVYLASGSVFNCDKCRFEGNTAKMYGGAVFAEQGASAVLKGCRFYNNSAVRGSAIYLQSDNGNYTTVADSQFISNTAEISGAIFFQSVSLRLSSSTFDGNRASKTPGISGMYSTVNITSCTFRNQQGSEAAFMSLLAAMEVTVLLSTFENGSGSSGCVLMFSSTLLISHCVFINLTGGEAGVVSASSGSAIGFQYSATAATTSKGTGSVIFAVDTFVGVDHCVFSNHQSDAITGVSLLMLRIVSSHIIDGNTTAGGAVNCLECDSVEITDSVFARQQSGVGALMIGSTNTATSVGRVTISNTRIEDCRSVSTGGMLISNSILDMWDCRFANNSALGEESVGGGMALACGEDLGCSYTITDTVFEDNSARKSGGGVYWTGLQPTLTNVTFINNKAPYGPKVASFPIELGINVTHSDAESRVLTDSIVAAPGQTIMATLTVSLLDHYGEVVNNDNDSVADFVMVGGSATASGNTKIPALNGVFTFSNILIYADQNSNVSAEITTPAIELSSDSIQFHMRDCIPGESRAPKSCLICAERTYSFDPNLPCQQCLSHTQCLGNFTVLPDSGYWRPGVYSELVFECPQKSACKGGGPMDDGSISYEGFCAEGYKSNMCQSCGIGYSRTTENKCGKCPSREVNIVRIVLVAIGVFIVNAVLLLSSLKSALQPKALHSIYFKIMANYWQLVFLITEFKLKWPSAVLQLFNAQQDVGGAAEQIYSVDCLLADNGDSSDIYYDKMIYIALLPVVVIAVAVLYWVCAALFYRKLVFLQRELQATVVIAFFIIHPTLMKSLFTLFSCKEIKDKEYWLTTDMSIRCGDQEHVFYTLIVGLSAIIVWVVGVPMVCLGVLIRHRRQLCEAWIRLRYGFLISGYRTSRFYWEFVILGRKLAVICCFVFINNSLLIQALSLQLVLLVVFYLQYEVRPYTTDVLNRMEMLAIMVADVTIYSGLYYLTDDLTDGGSWFFFAIIVLANAVFLVYWGAITLNALIEVAAKAVPSIGIRLFPALFERDADVEDFLTNIAPRDYSRFPIGEMKGAYSSVLAKNPIMPNGDPRNTHLRDIMDNRAPESSPRKTEEDQYEE